MSEVPRHNGLDADPEGAFVYYDEYTALRDERDRLREALKALVSEVGSYTVERQYYSREEASKDLDRREKALLAQLQHAKAALTPAGGGKNGR